jgi:hypothetical protein
VVEPSEPSATYRQQSLTWVQRLKRVFAIDIEVCRRCSLQSRSSVEENIEPLDVFLASFVCPFGSKRRIGLWGECHNLDAERPQFTELQALSRPAI